MGGGGMGGGGMGGGGMRRRWNGRRRNGPWRNGRRRLSLCSSIRAVVMAVLLLAATEVGPVGYGGGADTGYGGGAGGYGGAGIGGLCCWQIRWQSRGGSGIRRRQWRIRPKLLEMAPAAAEEVAMRRPSDRSKRRGCAIIGPGGRRKEDQKRLKAGVTVADKSGPASVSSPSLAHSRLSSQRSICSSSARENSN